MTDPYAEVQDPNTSAARLAELAAAHPELGPWIAAHPNAYPELRQWIATYAAAAAPATQAPTVETPVAQTPAAQTPAVQAPAVQAPADPWQAATPAPDAAPWQQPTTPDRFTPRAVPTDPFATPAASATTPTPPYTTPTAPYGTPADPFAPGGGAPAAPSGAGSARPRKSRKGLFIGLSIGIVAVLVLAGGGVWWFFASRLGGASSPEAAFTKLISGVESVDPLTLYGSFAPSEVGQLKDALTKLTSAVPGGDDGAIDIQTLLSDLKSSVTITTEDLTFDTEELADDVARVTWTDGSITIDGDEQKIADALVEGYAPAMRAQFEAYGYTDTEIDELLDEAKQSAADDLDLPYTLNADDVDSDDGQGIALVMVDEGSGWYVSPMLSYADTVYRSLVAYDSSVGRLGDEVVAGASFSTPEAAAEGLTNAVVSGDIENIAAALPLAERRLASIYGPALWDTVDYSSALDDLRIDSARFSSEIDGDTARVSIEDLTISGGAYSSSVEQDLYWSWTLSGTCANWTYEYPSSTYSYRYGYSYEVEQTTGSGCAEDVPVLDRLGVADVDLIATKENGGWFVSPTATIADAASIMVDNFMEYYQDGRLDELFE